VSKAPTVTTAPGAAAVPAGTATWFAPGRANLMGEHTDYNGGLVLPFALAQGITASAAARPDALLVLRSKQVPDDLVTVPLASLAPRSVPGWAAYPAGVAWALREAGYPVPGADIDIDSDLPVGAGVSSSAALECSVALALCDLGGHAIERRELARIARRAENDFVGAPTGMIDQSASLLCQAGHAMLLDCQTRAIRQVPFRPGPAGMAALVIDTRVPHSLADGQYAARRAECEEAARLLGTTSLGSLAVRASSRGALPGGTGPDAIAARGTGRFAAVADALLAGLADPVLRRRARHVLTDSARARAIADVLRAARPADRDAYQVIGDLLTEGHASLRDDFEVSWPQADLTVETALAAGAFGAKMIGGGFGGSVLALAPAAALPAVRSAIRTRFAGNAWESPGFLEAIPSPPARKIMLHP
jgi:galactokinase